MSQKTDHTSTYTQRPIEDILDFCVELGRRMIACGANVERVTLAVDRICKTYKLTDVSLFLLSTNIFLSARDSDGFYASRQLTIPPSDINLRRLQSLNRLSFLIAQDEPSPAHEVVPAAEGHLDQVYLHAYDPHLDFHFLHLYHGRSLLSGLALGEARCSARQRSTSDSCSTARSFPALPGSGSFLLDSQ